MTKLRTGYYCRPADGHVRVSSTPGHGRMPTVLVTLLMASATAVSTFAQQRPAHLRNPPASKYRPNLQPTLNLEVSAPLANLFSRAEEGILREDWKFAIDSLQRVVDHPEASLVSRGESNGCHLYESTRRQAMRRIAELPPAGLRAYRLLYDGKAKRLLEQARTELDPEPLRQVVRRFFPTTYGDDAADLLASWALDDGRAAETIRLLGDLGDFAPDSDIPKGLIAAKLAVANALLGRKDAADAAVQAFKEFSEGLQEAPSLGEPPSGQSPVDTVDNSTNWLENAIRTAHGRNAKRGNSRPYASAWPMLGGAPMRGGIMAPVAPDLVGPLPWTYDLPGKASEKWRRNPTDASSSCANLPRNYLVADSEHIYVRTPRGCAALVADTLTEAWSVPPDHGRSAPGAGRKRTLRRSSYPQPSPARVSENNVLHSLAVFHGVVLTVQSSRANAKPLIPDEYEQLRPPRGRRGTSKRGARATVVVAYEAESGQVRWQRGRSFNRIDPLGNVDFRAVPIEVGNTLWVPFIRKGDFLAGVLDPKDGHLIHEIHLHSMNTRMESFAKALAPVHADGLVLIPSDSGALFALDAGKQRVRWANVYSPVASMTRDGLAEQLEDPLSSVPAVVSGLTLFVPPRCERLLAFDTANGTLHWSSKVPSSAYIVAADAEHVWIGGWQLACHSLNDGKEHWRMQMDEEPSGRAILAGTVILIPTRTGLTTVDAASGEILRTQVLADSSAPLGNLLSLRSSIFSVDPGGVRRYVDLARLYPVTLSHHQRDPNNEEVAIQLGWMELMQDNARRALDVLDKTTALRSASDLGISVGTSRVHVEALLRRAKELCAESAEVSPPSQVGNLLERAGEVAQSAADRLRSGLALADHLDEIGRHGDSYRTLWSLGMSSDADQFLRLNDDLEIGARWIISHRIDDVLTRMDDDELYAANAYIDERVAQMVQELSSAHSADNAAQILRGLSDLPGAGRSAQYALLELSDWRVSREQHALAEQLLRKAVRLDADPFMTATALMNLADFHVHPKRSQIDAAENYLEILEGQFASVRISARTAMPGRGGSKNARPDGREESDLAASASDRVHSPTVGDWVRNLRENRSLTKRSAKRSVGVSGMRPRSLAEHLNDLPSFALGGEVKWSVRVAHHGKPPKTFAPFEIPEELTRALEKRDVSGPPRIVKFTGDHSFARSDLVVFFAPGDLLYCQRVSSGELQWHTVLRLQDELLERVPVSGSFRSGQVQYAVLDGQIAVIKGRDALHAFCLGTGKQLWIRPFPLTGEPEVAPTHRRSMAARDGMLLAAPEPGKLALMRISDGSSIWERDLRDEHVAHVWMNESVVITANERMQRVHILDRRDGTLIKQVLFRQPNPKSPMPVSFVRTGGALCGPVAAAESDSVSAVDELTGEPLWEITLDKPLGQLFNAKEGYVGVSLLGGDVRILDASTGREVFAGRVPGGHLVIDGVLRDNVLVIKHVEGGQTHPELTAFDVETGEELWYRGDLARAMANVDLVLVAGRLAAVISEAIDLETTGPRKGDSLALIDLHTGMNVGPLVELPFSSGVARFNGDLDIHASGVVVGTTHGVHSFSTTPCEDLAAEGS